MSLQIIEVPLSQLAFDEVGNVRVTDRAPDPTLLASIKAKGLIVPLRVRKDGKGLYLVVDGGKRLGALKELAKRNELATDAVPCIMSASNDDGAARDISLTANLIRVPMHPVDEYEAFAQLQRDGMSIEDICRHYGFKKSEANKVLALGRLSPTVRKAWRDGKIDEETASAFTLTDDHGRQDEVLKSLNHYSRSRYAVRSRLIGDQGDVQKYLNAVGKEAYEAAGGKIIEDLFAGRHETSTAVTDMALLKKLLDGLLQAECDKLVADGWGWAEIDHSNSRYMLDRLDRGGNKPKAADKPKAGCLVYLDHKGDVITDKWFVKGRAKVAGEKAKATKAASKEKKAPAVLSNALKHRLESQLVHATKDALAADSAAGTGLLPILGRIVVAQIDPDRIAYMQRAVRDKLNTVCDALTTKAFNEAIKKRFDAKDYFSSSPKEFVLKAIAEAVSKEEADRLKAKAKADIWKFAVANVAKTGWLPKELRTIHYDGPGSAAPKSAKPKTAAPAPRKNAA